MKTIATITSNQELKIQLPEAMPVGTFKVVLVIDEMAILPAASPEGSKRPTSFLEVAGDLIGCLEGLPPDLSTDLY